MGCCSNVGLKHGSKVTKDYIKMLINRNNTIKFKVFEVMLTNNSELRKFIGSSFIIFFGIYLSPLGYALIRNRLN